MTYKKRLNFGTLRRTFLLSISLGLAACGGKTTPVETPATEIAASAESTATAAVADTTLFPSIPSSPVEAPATLMLEGVLSNPHTQITELAAFADLIQPGAGAFVSPQGLTQILASVVKLQSLAGIDLNAPLYILATEGEKVLLVVTVSNEEQLTQSLEGYTVKKINHGKFAAIGDVDILTDVAPYALSNLITQPLPKEPTAILHISKIAKGSKANRLRSELKRETNEFTANILMEALESIDTLRFSLQTDAIAARILMSAHVQSGSLKTFIATQKPSDFSMVKRIGSKPWSVASAGRLDLAYLIPLLTQLGKESGTTMIQALLPQLGALKGEFAAGVDMLEKKKPEVILGMKLENAKAIKSLVDLVATGGANKKDLKFSGLPSKLRMFGLKFKGSKLHEFRITPKTAEDKKTFGKKPLFAYFGVAKETLIASYGPRSKSLAKILMNSKGPSIPGNGKELSKVIQSAKEKSESFVVALDIMSMQAQRPAKDVPPVVFGLGFTGEVINARVVFPVSAVIEAINHSSKNDHHAVESLKKS